MDRHW